MRWRSLSANWSLLESNPFWRNAIPSLDKIRSFFLIQHNIFLFSVPPSSSNSPILPPYRHTHTNTNHLISLCICVLESVRVFFCLEPKSVAVQIILLGDFIQKQTPIHVRTNSQRRREEINSFCWRQVVLKVGWYAKWAILTRIEKHKKSYDITWTVALSFCLLLAHNLEPESALFFSPFFWPALLLWLVALSQEGLPSLSLFLHPAVLGCPLFLFPSGVHP